LYKFIKPEWASVFCNYANHIIQIMHKGTRGPMHSVALQENKTVVLEMYDAEKDWHRAARSPSQ
jgi:hypothetical protein